MLRRAVPICSAPPEVAPSERDRPTGREAEAVGAVVGQEQRRPHAEREGEAGRREVESLAGVVRRRLAHQALLQVCIFAMCWVEEEAIHSG